MAKTYSKKDIFDGKLFDEAINEANQMIKVLEVMDTKIIQLSSTYKNTLSNATTSNKKGIEDIIKVSNELNVVTEQANKIEKDKIATSEKLRKAEAEQAKAYEQFTKEVEKRRIAEEKAHAKREQQYNKEIKQVQELSRPYNVLSKQLNELRKDYKDMAVAGEENTTQALELKKQIIELDAELKKVDATVGQHTRNVGNYEGAVKPLKTQLREMTQILQSMDESDPRFAKMAAEAGQLRDKINDTKDIINATAGTGVENLSKGFASAGKIGINAMQGVEGAMALFGVESEQVMQVLVRLQALSALTDAIEGLGALGDTMNQIKASFSAAAIQLGIFTTAKEVDTVVTEGQTVATEVATVATSGLGKAMKALPIVLLIAGIAALVTALSSYNVTSDVAARSIKFRKEQEEAALKATRAMNKEVAKESAQYVGLIVQLKNTNANSKERTDLINKINSQYGTTLKNLSDETAFQAALNLAIEDYIAFQTAKYKLQKNEKAIEMNLQTQADLNNVLATQKNKLEQAEAKLNSVKSKTLSIDQAMNMSVQQRTMWEKDHKNAVDEATRAYEEAQKQYGLTNASMSAAKGRLMAYGAANVQLTSQIDGKYVPALKESNAQVKKATESTKKYNDETQRSIELGERNLINVERTIEALESTDKRKTDLKDIAVLEAEITLEKANQSGNIKDIAEAEKAVTEAKKQAIQAQMEYDLKNESDPAKQELIRKNAELEILQLNKSIESDEKEHQKRMKEIRQKGVNDTIDELKQLSDERQKYLDETISKEQKMQDTLQAQANAGNITAQESIASSIEAQKKATLAKQQEQARQQRLEEIKILYNLIESKIDKGDSAPKAIGKSLAEMGLIRGASKLLDNIKGFYKGTKGLLKDEHTPIHGGKDGHLIFADGNEMIVNPTQTNKLASVGLEKTDDVVNSAIMYKMNVGLLGFNAKNPQATPSQTDMYLKKLVDVMESKGEFYLDPIVVNGIAKGVVSTEIKGNVTKYSEYRPKA